MAQLQAKVVGISKMLKVKQRINFHNCIKNSAKGIFGEAWMCIPFIFKQKPLKHHYMYDNVHGRWCCGHSSAYAVESQTWREIAHGAETLLISISATVSTIFLTLFFF